MSTEMLSLRVIRLNRPVFVRQQCEPTELYLDDVAGCLTTADAGIRADLDGAPMHRLPVGCGATRSGAVSGNSNSTVALTESSNEEKPIADLVRVKVGGPGELLSLPQSFGSTYLGETFSAHMNLHNESDQICYNVDLKVTLHNSIEWINLSTTGTLTGASIPAMSACSPEIASRTSTTTGSVDLHPGQSLNAVIHYELKELGAHTLRCTASYCMHAQSQSTTSTVQAVSTGMKAPYAVGGLHADQSGLETYTFQRLYRFTVIKPLDVKKKFSLVDLDGTVFMEAQVQNLTTAPIFLERVAFEPSPHLTVVDLNVTDRKQQFPLKTMPVCLRPEDVRQFLFRLTPTASLLQLHTVKSITSDASRTTSAPLRPMGPQPSQPIQQPPISAGRLDITWRETMGERGRLQTSSLKYEIPNTADIQVKPIEIPSTVTVEKPFEIRIELSNRSANALELLLDLETVETPDGDENASDLPSPVKRDEADGGHRRLSTTTFRLPALVWTGLTTRKLGSLTPGQTKPISLHLIPTVTGLQAIPSVIIHELTMDWNYEFNELGHVLVCAT